MALRWVVLAGAGIDVVCGCGIWHGVNVTIELPELKGVTPAELKLELACALFARGKIGKVGGADLAGVSFFEFQRALGERQIESYTVEMLEQDLKTLKTLFPA
jgi:predicted HTH domain antitoxin